MVWKVKCDCNERISISVDSQKLFSELRTFFEMQEKLGIMKEEKEKEPFYVWRDDKEESVYYATKWYRCVECGCLWEFQYPDFPAKGFVRKFVNGVYTGKEIVLNGYE